MASAVFLLSVVVLTLQLATVYPEPAEKCLNGKYHKKTPSAEGLNYSECFAWKNKSCCTADFTIELKNNRVENLWNFTWNHCGNLSKACEKYIKDEECFFQCEPNLIKWETRNALLRGVPICHSYCESWFEACKDDKTCVTNWLADLNFTSSTYSCPVESKCRTFAQVYGNAQGLCNKMWGESFKYEKSTNCMVMDFKGPGNPNDKVTEPVQMASTLGTSAAAMMMGVLLIIFL